MFLIRLLYIKEDKIIEDKNIDLKHENYLNNLNISEKNQSNKNEEELEVKNKTISQIKNFSQEETLNPERKIDTNLKKAEIRSFDNLINLCNENKELKLKYELETNVSLVSFVDKKIEISFNENLDKDFVKDLSLKLYEWTGQRWIIAFSKEIGELSKKQKEDIEKLKIIDEVKKKDVFKKIIETFPDAKLVDVKLKDKIND